MTIEGRPPVVAVVNSSDDIVELLRLAFQQAGFNTITEHVPRLKSGAADFLAIVEQHQPDAIVYDVSPPYEENWAFLKLLRSSEASAGRVFVITTTNKRVLDSLVGENDAVEIVGKPYDIDTIVDAVRQGLQQR